MHAYYPLGGNTSAAKCRRGGVREVPVCIDDRTWHVYALRVSNTSAADLCCRGGVLFWTLHVCGVDTTLTPVHGGPLGITRHEARSCCVSARIAWIWHGCMPNHYLSDAHPYATCDLACSTCPLV